MGSRKIPEIRRDLLDKCVAKGIEIKTQCIFCGKRFWVQASTVAWAMHHNQEAKCSACGYPLKPIIKGAKK